MRHTLFLISLTLAGPLAAQAETFAADVWADNWFEMRIDGVQVAEDSVPITTERSFNAESFTFEAERPFTIGLVAKDYIENDTGLEYIGSSRQQMGDGGVIAQIMDASGAPVVVSDDSWQCLVIHTAPLDKSCENVDDPVAGEGACGFSISDEPNGWDTAGFDASDWPAADVYTSAQVDPKIGYDDVTWDASADFIWGPDLEQSNTVLCPGDCPMRVLSCCGQTHRLCVTYGLAMSRAIVDVPANTSTTKLCIERSNRKRAPLRVVHASEEACSG